ncbi:glutathione S-transferase family protein [Parvibaculum sp.]|jgi:glutathione S-transferase|uniref:glutathione S-transferase family protein n=1 Tax=Parvibaculum sp. TaxID=2024848 RepID=UPI002FD9C40E
MIRLCIFPASLKGTPNPSSFCLKLEAALRLAGVPHELSYETDPRKAPKGKLPFIEFEGKRIGDSALILNHLKETLGVDLDRGLSDAERAQSHMLQRMLDERLYWVIVHNRWIEEANWPTVKALFFGGLPFPLSAIVPRMARKSVRAALTAHGIGRHAAEEIYGFGKQDLAAMAAMLGDKPFFFGDKPTLADVSVFATLVNITGPEMESPLKDAALGHDNLLRHTERMGEIYASTRQKQRIELTLAA